MKIVPRLHRIALGGGAATLAVLLLLACQAAGTGADTSQSDAADLALVRDVMRRVEKSYIEPVTADAFVTNALKGALTGLDPHSDYMTEKEYHDMLSETRGEFGGLGMELTEDHGIPKVISPIDDTPAARAGVRAGDFIIKIADLSTENMALKDVVDRLRGPAGTPIALTILRTGQTPFELTLTRANIQIVSVKSHMAPNKIGYVRISTFAEKTQDELTDAIARLRQQAGGQLNGFVLDLRNDPGGLLDAAVDVSGDFLSGGTTVVTTRGREDGDDHVFTPAIGGDRLQGTPVVVLINGASASASEIVAGALQDEHRATVMGTRSFGKGSVQTIVPLNGRGALRLTTARYYTPAGRSIQDHGITPEIIVAAPKDEQAANAVAFHEADLRGALKNTGSLGAGRSGTAVAAAPAESNLATKGDAGDVPIDPTIIGTDKDTQLTAALNYLRQSTAKSAVLPRG
jgi:carboxyl-terminal processing protease